MELIPILIAIPCGLLAGGFATMLIDRIPDKTALTVASRCPQCEGRLGLGEIIPVLSWVLRRGRCRHCSSVISSAYPMVELVTASLFVLVVIEHGLDWLALPSVVLVVALVALSTIDMYVYRLPDRLVFPAIVVSAVAMIGVGFAIDRLEALPKAAAGAIGYFLLLFIAHLVSPRGMGFGDVKLALLLGLHLGWTAGSIYVGWLPVIRLVFFALFIGCVVGVAVGILVAVLRRLGRDLVPDPAAGDEPQAARRLQNSFPFGTALAAATMLLVLYPDLAIG